MANVGDVTGDGVDDVALTWLADSLLAVVHSGRTGKVALTIEWPSERNLDSGGATGDVTGLGDIDGDDVPDFAVGVSTWSSSGPARPDVGRVYVVSGRLGRTVRTMRSPAPVPYGYFGQSVAGIGDVDGDGLPEIAVGAMGEAEGAGRVHVFGGATNRVLYTIEGTSRGERFVGTRFGEKVARLGDIDEDGAAEIGVGAQYDRTGRGSVSVFSGRSGALLYRIESPSIYLYSSFGFGLSDAGDVNQDGTPDVLVGAFSDDTGRTGSGRSFVFSGRDGTLVQTLSPPTASRNSSFGYAVAGVPDADSDGTPDFLVGSPRRTLKGLTYLVSSQTGAVLNVIEPPEPGNPYHGWSGHSIATSTGSQGDGWFAIGALSSPVYLYRFGVSPAGPPLALGSVYPNPTRGSITVSLSVPASGDYAFRVIDIRGRVMRTETRRVDEEGRARVRLDLSDLPSGIYSVILTGAGPEFTRRVTVVR